MGGLWGIEGDEGHVRINGLGIMQASFNKGTREANALLVRVCRCFERSTHLLRLRGVGRMVFDGFLSHVFITLPNALGKLVSFSQILLAFAFVFGELLFNLVEYRSSHASASCLQGCLSRSHLSFLNSVTPPGPGSRSMTKENCWLRRAFASSSACLRAAISICQCFRFRGACWWTWFIKA